MSGQTLLETVHGVSVTNTGYVSDWEPKLCMRELVRHYRKDPELNFTTELGGVFALAFLDNQREEMRLCNSISRTQPLVYCVAPDLIAVGSRAILVHLAATGFKRPSYDLQNMVDYICNGYYITDRTPFKKTLLLPSSSRAVLQNGELKISSIDDLAAQIGLGDEVATTQDFDDLAEILLKSVRWFSHARVPPELGLSGGKDSRVVASAFVGAGVPLRTKTTGYTNHPDLTLGTKLAKQLGLPNKSIEFSADAGRPWQADIHTSMCNDLFTMDGMHINMPSSAPVVKSMLITESFDADGPSLVLSGTGGECLRGGYAIHDRSWAQNQTQLTSPQVRQILRRVYFAREDAFEPSLFQNYRANIEHWLNQHFDRRHPTAVLEKMYLYFSEASKNAFVRNFCAIKGGDHAPLVDNRFLRRIVPLESGVRLGERIHFELIKRLAPNIINTPICDGRWGFEADGPRTGDTEGYKLRAPVFTRDHSQVISHAYFLVGTHFRAEFRERIFNPEIEDTLFTILRQDVINKLFESERIYQTEWSWFLWHVYAASILLADSWLEVQPPSVDKIEVHHNVPWHTIVLELLQAVDRSFGYSPPIEPITAARVIRSMRTGKWLLAVRNRTRIARNKLVSRFFKASDPTIVSNVAAEKPAGSESLYCRTAVSALSALALAVDSIGEKYRVSRKPWRDFLDRVSCAPLTVCGGKTASLWDILEEVELANSDNFNRNEVRLSVRRSLGVIS